MHTTLQPKTQMVLMSIWSAVILAVLVVASPRPWLFLGIGAGFGLLGGILQLRAFRESPARFVAAKTAVEVRRAISASRFGRLYIYTFWLSQIAIFALSFFLLGGRAIVGFIGGYASFSLVRELLTLPGSYELRRFSEEQRK